MAKIFLLEDEIYKDGGFNHPPRPHILKYLARHQVTIALDFEEAKNVYDPNAGYTHLLLDHDFEGYPNPNLAHPNCGYAFVKWMTKFKLPVPQPEIYLHTQNKAGRLVMAKLLEATGYKKVIHSPYGPEFIATLSAKFL